MYLEYHLLTKISDPIFFFFTIFLLVLIEIHFSPATLMTNYLWLRCTSQSLLKFKCHTQSFKPMKINHSIFQSYNKQLHEACSFNYKIYWFKKNIVYLNSFVLYTGKNDICIVKRGMYNSISASFILHLHCASSVSHCIHSFKQQSQWLILCSICYCMAEGSCAEHTCPATCLHHRARAGRDSVC